jgi:thioredoxin-related protein
MKKIAVIVLLLLAKNLAYSQATEAAAGSEKDLTWHADVNKAYDLSKATSKPIFAFFTGSDWCGWCHKLQREVFSKPAFVAWANENVVLLELDFPRRKQLPAEIAQQNQSLQQFFQVTGYPTIWMFNLSRDGEKNKMMVTALGSLGYPSGAESGREEVKFLENANAVLAKNNK